MLKLGNSISSIKKSGSKSFTPVDIFNLFISLNTKGGNTPSSLTQSNLLENLSNCKQYDRVINTELCYSVKDTYGDSLEIIKDDINDVDSIMFNPAIQFDNGTFYNFIAYLLCDTDEYEIYDDSPGKLGFKVSYYIIYWNDEQNDWVETQRQLFITFKRDIDADGLICMISDGDGSCFSRTNITIPKKTGTDFNPFHITIYVNTENIIFADKDDAFYYLSLGSIINAEEIQFCGFSQIELLHYGIIEAGIRIDDQNSDDVNPLSSNNSGTMAENCLPAFSEVINNWLKNFGYTDETKVRNYYNPNYVEGLTTAQKLSWFDPSDYTRLRFGVEENLLSVIDRFMGDTIVVNAGTISINDNETPSRIRFNGRMIGTTPLPEGDSSYTLIFLGRIGTGTSISRPVNTLTRKGIISLFGKNQNYLQVTLDVNEYGENFSSLDFASPQGYSPANISQIEGGGYFEDSVYLITIRATADGFIRCFAKKLSVGGGEEFLFEHSPVPGVMRGSDAYMTFGYEMNAASELEICESIFLGKYISDGDAWAIQNYLLNKWKNHYPPLN